MKKLIFLFVLCLICSFPALAFDKVKEFNQPAAPISKVALIQFSILPPISGGLAAKMTYNYYKNNTLVYCDLLGDKIKSDTTLEFEYGSKLYSSPKYQALKNCDIATYEKEGPKLMCFDLESLNFFDYSKYKLTNQIIENQYSGDQANLAKIAAALKVDGVMVVYFYMDGGDNMFLQAVLFDVSGALVKKVSVSKINLFLMPGNFEKNYLSTVERLVTLLNKQ